MVAEKSLPEGAPRAVNSYRPNLPRQERLSSWAKRIQIINQGKSIKYDGFYVSILPQDKWELSIIVKKNSGKAFKRNEYRRKIKESFRLGKTCCLRPAAIAITVYKPLNDLRVLELKEIFVNNVNT